MVNYILDEYFENVASSHKEAEGDSSVGVEAWYKL